MKTITINFYREGERIAQHEFKSDFVPRKGDRIDLEYINIDMEIEEQYAEVKEVTILASNLYNRKVRELQSITVRCEVIPNESKYAKHGREKEEECLNQISKIKCKSEFHENDLRFQGHCETCGERR